MYSLRCGTHSSESCCFGSNVCICTGVYCQLCGQSKAPEALMQLRKSALGHADSNACANLEDLVNLLPHAEVKRVRRVVAERLVHLRMSAT